VRATAYWTTCLTVSSLPARVLLLAHPKVVALADVHDRFGLFVDVPVNAWLARDATFVTLDDVGFLHSARGQGTARRGSAGGQGG
jgi:hypothetical protein